MMNIKSKTVMDPIVQKTLHKGERRYIDRWFNVDEDETLVKIV